MTAQIYAENEHFYADWPYITPERALDLHFEVVNPPRVIRILLRAYPNYPYSVCHSFASLKDRSEAKPKNLGWVSPVVTQMLHFVQHDRR